MTHHPCFDAPGPRPTRPPRAGRGQRLALATTGVLTVLALTACEDENGNHITTPGGDTVPVDQARRLEDALMSADDLSGDWERDFQSAPVVLTPSCEGIDLIDVDAAVGRAPRRSHGDEEIENMIVVFDTGDDASAHLERFASSTTSDCLQSFVQRSALDGRGIDVEGLEIDLERSAPASNVDEAASYRIVADVEALGLDLDVYLDIVAVRAGRAVAYFSFLEMGEPLTDPQPGLIDNVVQQLRVGGLT